MSEDLTYRVLWLAIACITALFIATGAGVLTRLAGAHPAKSVIAAGTAFAGTMLLILAIFSYVWH